MQATDGLDRLHMKSKSSIPYVEQNSHTHVVASAYHRMDQLTTGQETDPWLLPLASSSHTCCGVTLREACGGKTRGLLS